MLKNAARDLGRRRLYRCSGSPKVDGDDARQQRLGLLGVAIPISAAPARARGRLKATARRAGSRRGDDGVARRVTMRQQS